MKKNWKRSRTIIFNVISGAVIIANELSGKIIPTEIATGIIIVGNIILRFLTKDPI